MKINELKKIITEGGLEKHSALYSDVSAQKDRFIKALCAFEKKYGSERDVFVLSVPGRSEIIGNHTDHNNGKVMAGAINRDIIAIAAKNNDNVIRFLHLVNDKNGLNIGYRHISLSTCGLVPEIKRLAEENLPITLSVSLHAPNDEIRNSMMPVNRRYPIKELLCACKEYQRATGRRISFEYALVHGVNDSLENARELAGRLRGLLCHVNLIPVNPIKEKNYKKTTKNNLILFTNELNNSKINATVRRKLGADIDAACGQLRNKKMQEITRNGE